MKKIILPDDLKKLQQDYNRKVLFNFGKYMSVAIIICILLHFKVKNENYSNTDRIYYIDAVLLAIPFFTTKIIKKLTSFSWYGEINDIKVKTLTRYRMIGRTFKIFLNHTIQLEIKTKKGTKNVTAYSTEKPTVIRKDNYFTKKTIEITNIDEELSRYKKGYRVAHIYGFDKLWIKREKTITCIVCGEENDVMQGKCANCHNSLIRSYREANNEM